MTAPKITPNPDGTCGLDRCEQCGEAPVYGASVLCLALYRLVDQGAICPVLFANLREWAREARGLVNLAYLAMKSGGGMIPANFKTLLAAYPDDRPERDGGAA